MLSHTRQHTLRCLSCNWLRHWTGGARMLGRSLVFVACFLPRLAFQGSSLCPTWLQLCPSPISPVPFAQKNPPSSFRASSGTCQETGKETTDKILFLCSPRSHTMDSPTPPPSTVKLPPSLEAVRITSLPRAAYYIADFITEEEEEIILHKVAQRARLWSPWPELRI
jgi:hypothetical protein